MSPARTGAGQQRPPILRLVGVYVQIKPGKGARLRARRIKRGLTQAQLGYLCSETSQAAISLIEGEKMKTCTQELAEDICKYLDLELEDYFEVRSDVPMPVASTAYLGSRRRPGRRGGRRPKGSTLGQVA